MERRLILCVEIFVDVCSQFIPHRVLLLVITLVYLRLVYGLVTSITIGNYVKIGGDCIIMDTDAHSLNFNIRRSIEKNEQGYRVDGLAAATAPIIIEDDVLIGTRCIILKGVIIGARTVIGSGSVVTKSIPADCIAAGNPCRVIKYIER